MTLGWYIHHHGRGHLNRFLAVAPELEDLTVLSSLAPPTDHPGTAWMELPLDVPLSPTQQRTVEAGGLLHWAPLGDTGYRRRMAIIAEWIADANPAAIVVDVSVEVALLARLLGAKVIWVAQRGIRDDAGHRLAYRAADMVIAPWTAATETDAETETDAGRVVHVGALSRFDGRTPTRALAERRVVLLLGFGGHSVRGQDIAAAAAATPDWIWEVTGVTDVGDVPNVVSQPSDCDVWALLNRAAVVVASASGNAVAEVAAARRPLICLPQERPFAEQQAQAAALARAGLAVVLAGWPPPERWLDLLDSAREHDPSAWAALHDGAGARRFAAAVRTAAESCA
jgi:hypothetical protein